MAASRDSNMRVLPEEVLEIIFSYLEPVRNAGPRSSPSEDCQHNDDKSINTLSSICKSSKAFYRIAHPYLYRTVHLPGSEISKDRRLLLRSLLRNSSLAKEVRHLGVGRERWSSPSKNDVRPEDIASVVFDEELHSLATRRLQSLPLSLSMREEICMGVKERILHCEIMCFAAICTHIQVLDLPDWPLEIISKHLTRLVTDVGKSNTISSAARGVSQDRRHRIQSDCDDEVPLPLSHIWKLTVNLAYSSSSLTKKIRLSAVAPMLLLPRLETFSGNMLDITRSDQGRPHMVAGSLMLRTASLTNARFNAESLGDFLRGCPNLETLCLDGLHMRNGAPFWRCFEDIAEVLDKYGTKLQCLSLIPRNKFREGREIVPLGGRLTGLQFLRKLVVPALFLIGRLGDQRVGDQIQYYIYDLRPLLPVSIEELQIEGGDDLHTPAFGDLLLYLLPDGDFARLRRVSFRRRLWATRNFLQQCESRPWDSEECDPEEWNSVVWDLGVWDSSKSTRTDIVLERLT